MTRVPQAARTQPVDRAAASRGINPVNRGGQRCNRQGKPATDRVGDRSQHGRAGAPTPPRPAATTCDGACRPDLSLYDGGCSAHGFAALLGAFEAPNDEAADR